MILPYSLRLLCLCFACFFVWNGAAGLMAMVLSKPALRFAESRSSAEAAGFLLALRLLPVVVAAFFVFCFCIPSYLRFEPLGAAEREGAVSLMLGFLGAATWFLALARTALSLVALMRSNRLWRSSGMETRLPGAPIPAVIVPEEDPLLALSGLIRPRLFLSRGVLRDLPHEELEAALRHEHAHHISRDNAKRLLLLLAPDNFPFFRPLSMLESGWAKFAELAADDRAAAGDSRKAVSLAAALVHVARMGSGPRLPFLSSSLVASDHELSVRVNRLLLAAPAAAVPTSQSRLLHRCAGLLLAGCLAVLLLAPSTLAGVHELLEYLLH